MPPISIHTLRVEGDRSSANRGPCPYNISIHTLRVEGDRPRLVLVPN